MKKTSAWSAALLANPQEAPFLRGDTYLKIRHSCAIFCAMMRFAGLTGRHLEPGQSPGIKKHEVAR
jgi:hypothetical protein